jgi:protein transport protein SEC23
LAKKKAPAPTFVFVIDTCVDSNELDALRDSISLSLELIPENARIGLIVYGTTVFFFF